MTEESTERDYEAEAKAEGWAPQDQWNGPEDKWKDAKTFVEDGEKINPILKSKVRRLEDDIAALKEANKKFGEFHNTTVAEKQKKVEALKKELEQARKQAISEGDGDAFDRADKQLEELRTTAPPEDKPLPPEAAQWLDENQWYNTNKKLHRYANGVADEIVAEGYTGAAYFAELTRRVKADYPEEFTNTRRAESGAVEGGGEKETKNSKAKTYANLPAEAKVNCDRFVGEGFMTREDFVKQYEWE